MGEISSWRDRYGLPKNTYSRTESVLKELKETQKELTNQMDTNSEVARKLLTRIDDVVKENESLKEQRHLSQNIEEKYMCRRLGQWNVDKYENEVREYEEKEDPRCHQCSRRQSELTGDNIMVSCTHDLSSTHSVRNTGCGLPTTCTKKFCTHCLDKVYQMKLRATQRKWKCPHCRDGCFNFRCLRESRLDILRPRFYGKPTLSKTQTGTLKRATLVLKRQGAVVGLCGICMRIEPVGVKSSLVQCTGIGCRTFVHPKCARSMNCKKITEKNWLCEVCEKGEDTERLRCALCPNHHVPTYDSRIKRISPLSSRATSPIPTQNGGRVSPTIPTIVSNTAQVSHVMKGSRRFGAPLLGLPAFTWDSKEKRWIHVVCKRWSEYEEEEDESSLPKTRNSIKRDESTSMCDQSCDQSSDEWVSVRSVRAWCSSAKRENITLLIHLLRGLTRNNINRAFLLF